MAITARNLEGISGVLVSLSRRLPLPEAQHVFALFSGENAKGARLLDDTALKVRVFTFPALDLQIACESTRVRFDLLKPHKPDEFHLGEVMGTFAHTLYPEVPFERFGFNYDTAYQYDAVIPQRELWKTFMHEDLVEEMTHFGWQATFQKEKGKRRDTCFFKVVSPLELRVLTNVELDRPLPPQDADTQALFAQCYTESHEIVRKMAFS